MGSSVHSGGHTATYFGTNRASLLASRYKLRIVWPTSTAAQNADMHEENLDDRSRPGVSGCSSPATRAVLTCESAGTFTWKVELQH